MQESSINILPVFRDFLKSKKRICMLMGGAGSGKSHVVAQKIILRLINPLISDELGSIEPNSLKKEDMIEWEKTKSCNWLVVRRTLNANRQSTFQLMVRLINEMGFSKFFEIRTGNMKIICKNGNYVVFKGLDDPEKLKSIDGISNIWVEEVTECAREAVDELFFRLRAKCNYNQLIMTFNPISAKHWIKEFWDTDNDEIYKIKTTFSDNYKLPESFVNSLLKLYPEGTYRHSVYILGNWGSVKSNSSLYHSFDDMHMGSNVYRPDLPLHLSFDFNVQPYSACLAFQIDEEEKVINLIKEIVEPYPATSQALVNKVIDNFNSHKTLIYVYGDASGDNMTTISTRSNFNIIMDELNDYYDETKVVYKVASRNPSIIESVNFINYIFSENFDYKLRIDSKCDETIDDLMNMKSDKNGSKLKEMGKTDDGVSYEKWGHTSDCLRYFICSCFPQEFSDFTNRGKSIEPVWEVRNSKLLGKTETFKINDDNNTFNPFGSDLINNIRFSNFK